MYLCITLQSNKKPFKMTFKDFENPQDLIGKTVLLESGHSYSDKLAKRLVKITKVTKTGFRIVDMPDVLFDIRDGYQKGLSGRMSMGIISRCKLLTNSEADMLRHEWALKRQKNVLKESIKAKLDTLSLEQLKAMDKI